MTPLRRPKPEIVWVLQQAQDAQQQQQHHHHMGQSMDEQPAAHLHQHQMHQHMHREQQVCAPAWSFLPHSMSPPGVQPSMNQCLEHSFLPKLPGT